MAAVPEPASRVFPAAWLGLAQVGLRDLDRAAEILRWGTETERLPDGLTGACLAMRGVIEQMRGDVDEALDAMDAAQAIFATDPWGIATDFDSFWLATKGPVLSVAGCHDEALDLYARIVERVHDEGSPVLVLQVVLGCLGSSATVCGAPEVGVQLLVRGVEQPISPLDHLSFSRYLEEASRQLPDDLVEELKAKGRLLTFAEAAALGMAALP
jgi:hypothetical protein